MSLSISEEDALQGELRNIQSVILLTRKNMDDMNAKFAGYQNPPSLYVTEHLELTSKLHDFEVKKQQLIKQLNDLLQQNVPGGSRDAGSVTLSSTSGANSSYKFGSISPYKDEVMEEQSTLFLHDETPHLHKISHDFTRKTLFPLAFCTYCKCLIFKGFACQKCGIYFHRRCSVAVGFVCPFYEMVLALLACICQMPTYPAVPASRDAGSVTRSSTSGANSSYKFGLISPCEDEAPHPHKISHDFTRKTLFPLAFCNYCKRLIFKGFACQKCGIYFHRRCSVAVEPICPFYEMVLALSACTCQTPTYPGCKTKKSANTGNFRIPNYRSNEQFRQCVRPLVHVKRSRSAPILSSAYDDDR